MADNIEMKPVSSQKGADEAIKPNLEVQEAKLIDVGEPDVEKAQSTAATAAASEEHHDDGNISPLTVPAAEPTVVVAPKKKKALFAKFDLLAKNKVYVIGAGVIIVLLAAIIALGVIVSKDNKKIHHKKSFTADIDLPKIGVRGDGYLDGLSGVFDHPLHDLVKDDIVIKVTTSTNGTTTFAFKTLVVNTTMTVTATANMTTLLGSPANTTMVSVAAVSPSSVTIIPPIIHSVMESDVDSSSTPSPSSEMCGESGDGAGPCTRPYGSPNSTPESVLSVMSVATLPVSTGVFGTSMVDGISVSSSACDPAATVFITVTITPDTEHSTMTASSTEIDLTTSTVQGSTDYLTMTETVSSTGTTAPSVTTTMNGSLTTLKVPTFTITLQSTVGPNGTATSTVGTPGPTGTIIVASGGEKVIGKPLGASGRNTGNGLYCAVMLVGLIVLLI